MYKNRVYLNLKNFLIPVKVKKLKKNKSPRPPIFFAFYIASDLNS